MQRLGPAAAAAHTRLNRWAHSGLTVAIVARKHGTFRMSSTSSSSSQPIAVNTSAPVSKAVQTWVQVTDKETGGTYWWCELTNETTSVGALKPQAWEEVLDQATDQTYWWCKETNQTTAIGSPRPTWAALQQQQHQDPFPMQRQQSSGLGLGSYFAWGIGIAVAFTVVGAIFR